MKNAETKRQQDKYQHEQQQKQIEFENALKQPNIKKEIKLGVKQMECTHQQPATQMQTNTNEKKYVPRLPNYQQGENIVVFLDIFRESMLASATSIREWVSRLRDTLTGKVLRTFQDLSETDKQSFETVRDRLLLHRTSQPNTIVKNSIG